MTKAQGPPAPLSAAYYACSKMLLASHAGVSLLSAEPITGLAKEERVGNQVVYAVVVPLCSATQSE
jgi:hypothetical protein